MKTLILVLLLLPVMSFGADVTITIVHPTENADGTPLTDLAGCNVYVNDVLHADMGMNLTHQITGVTEPDVITSNCYDDKAPPNLSAASNSVSVGIAPDVPTIQCSAVICTNCTVNVCQ